MHQDTIAAISTPLGEGAIGVVRVSGADAVSFVDKIFSGRTSLLEVKSHTVHYGLLLDAEKRQPMDEVLVTVMRSPRTFTREDVVEVSGHGGIFVIQRVLQAILSAGARLAEPGEFTKRAFLNGRLDLSQAEAVMDLIRAKSDEARLLALKQVEGRLSHRVRDLRRELIEVLAHIEVTIDYPEHDVEDVTYRILTDKARHVKDEVGRMILSSRQGRVLREGVVTAIVGRPNVGKSSLLNALARQNRAIVTDIPGTTRDVIEESVIVGGIPLLLQDTAGIRETEDQVEKIGVQRSKEVMSEAELILLVFNGSEELTAEDRQLLPWVADKNALAIINKADLPQRIDASFLERAFPGRVIRISSLLGDGLDELESSIRECFLSGEVSGSDLTYVSNSRHIALLQQVDRRLEDALRALYERLPVDMVGIDLREAWALLGEVIGEEVGEGLIDQIFTQFCLGK